MGARPSRPMTKSWAGVHQLLAGHLAGLVIHALYGVRFTDMGPLRAIRRDALDRLGMRERTSGGNLEMQMRAAKAGLRITRTAGALPQPRWQDLEGRGDHPRDNQGSRQSATAMVRIACDIG